MIAIVAYVAVLVIGGVLLYLALAMIAGILVGLIELTDSVWRHLRGRPQRKQKPVPHANRVPVPFEVRAAVWARDGGACVYCTATNDLTVDHVIPRVLGGSNDPENLVTACRPCNSRKGAKASMPSPHDLTRRRIISLWRADRLRAHNGRH